MATNACKFLYIVLFFAFVAQGYGQCSIEKLSMEQSKTGKMVENKPEWEVIVTNPCPCIIQDTKLSCVGLQSITPIDPSVLTKTGDDCEFVNNLLAYSNIGFKYVWDTDFNFKIIDGTITCS